MFLTLIVIGGLALMFLAGYVVGKEIGEMNEVKKWEADLKELSK